MKTIFYVVFIIFMAGWTVKAQDVKSAEKSSVNIEIHRFSSKVFNNTRSIRILLPPDYHDPKNKGKNYPVLYLNDGIMVFHAFNIEETVHRLISTNAVPPLIIVGIDNGGSTDKTKNPGADRSNEFLPYPDVGFAPDLLYEPEVPSPVGKSYPDFMAEVMMFIKQNYRIQTGPKNTGIGGFSYGGVAALYTGMTKPHVFGRLLVESTPLWIGKDKQLLKDTRQTKKWADRIYVGLGTNESPNPIINKEGQTEQAELIAIIRKNSPKTVVKQVLDEGAKHSPSAWSKRFPAALQFLFGK